MRKLGTFFIVLISIAIPLYFIVTSFTEMGDFSDIAAKFADDVKKGDYESAYARLSGGYRNAVSLDSFTRAISSNIYLKGAEGIGFNELTTRGGAATAEGRLRSAAGDVNAVFNFTEEDGAWKITGIILGGVPALPGFADSGNP